ncbi:MAG TPA: glycosyltransferase family 39 protein [Candidatus Binatia bacterium]
MRVPRFLATAALFAYIAAVALASSVLTGLDHDEHQFMASAYLAAEHNLHPYQDFPYFHMPNLVYIHAAFFRFSDYPFLCARLFSAFCAIGIALTIFLISRSLFKDDQDAGLIVAASASVLLTNSPLFASAAAQAWNHTSSTFCALLAFVFHGAALRRAVSWKFFLLSGFFLGMAIGIRLSFAPLIVPFLAVVFLSSARRSRTLWPALAAFAIGGLAANLPALYFLAAAPDKFFFGNFGYAALNTLYRQEMNYGKAMTLGAKLEFFFRVVFLQPENLLIAAVVVGSLLGALAVKIRRAVGPRSELVFLLLLLPFLYIGAFAPTPVWYQYFFAPTAFLVLVAPYGLALVSDARKRRWSAWALLIAAFLSLASGVSAKTPASVPSLFRPASWFPVRLHKVSEEIAGRLTASRGAGMKILTLSPLYAVEKKLPVYPEFATGQFAWRVSHLLSPDERERQSLVGPADVDNFVKKEPPSAILTTSEARSLREPLTQMAQRLGYLEIKLSDGSVLWIAPERRYGRS